MSSENSKTFNPHRLLFNLTDKIDKYIAISMDYNTNRNNM